MTRQCALCGKHLDVTNPATYRRVIGWTRKELDPRRQGGSDVRCRQALDFWAHSDCVDREKAGLLPHPQQEALL